MATVVLQFQVNAGAVSTGVATVAAEDEIDLRLAIYSGLQSIRYEIQAFPAGFAEPSGWSTDVSSGAYYFSASPIVGLTPPTITMPTTAEIAAGQWGKWIFRAIGTTSTGTITSDPRCGVKIVSPALGLNGIAFSEEDEFDATRAYPGELQEDLVEIDGAALVSGGFVGSLAATAPIKVDAATGAVTASWLATGNVTMSGYGWTSCTGVTNAGGALALTAGGGAASLAGSTTATVSANGGALLCEGATTTTITAGSALAMTGATTASLTATAGALTCTGGTTAALTASGGAATITSSTEVNVSPLLNVRRNDATANTTLDVATLRRTTSDAGFGQTGIGGRLAFELEDSAGNADVAGTIAVDYLDATSTTEDARILFRTQVAGTLTDSLSLRGTTIRAHGLAGSGSGFVAVDNNGDFSYSAGAGASATEKYLVNDTTTALANGVPTQDLASTVYFVHGADLPLYVQRGAAATNTMLDALILSRTSDTVGAAGIGPSIRLYTTDAAGDTVDAGIVGATLTDATGGAHASQIEFWAAAAGASALAGTLSGAGYLTTTGFIGASIDRATAGAFAIGPSTATSVVITPNTTITGTLAAAATTIAVDDATTNAVTTVATLRHTTSGTAAANIGTRLAMQTEDTAGNTDDAVYVDAIFTTATSGAESSEWSVWTRASGGSMTKRVYYSPSAPGIGGTGLVTDTIIAATGNGFMSYAYSTAAGSSNTWGGVNYNDSDSGMRFYATGSAQSLYLRTNSTNRVKIDPSGNQTHSLPATSAIRRQWGTAGVNYVDEAANVTTTTDATTTTIFTVAMADNSSLEWEVHTYCYDIDDPTKRVYAYKLGGFNRNGGAPTSDWEADGYADKVIGGWGGGVSVVLTEGVPTTNDVSVQVTGLSGKNIKWESHITYRVRTTSA